MTVHLHNNWSNQPADLSVGATSIPQKQAEVPPGGYATTKLFEASGCSYRCHDSELD
jgi:hypothetical protein